MGARATSRWSTRIRPTSILRLRRWPRSRARRQSPSIRRRTTLTSSSRSAVPPRRHQPARSHRRRADAAAAAAHRVRSSLRGLSLSSSKILARHRTCSGASTGSSTGGARRMAVPSRPGGAISQDAGFETTSRAKVRDGDRSLFQSKNDPEGGRFASWVLVHSTILRWSRAAVVRDKARRISGAASWSGC